MTRLAVIVQGSTEFEANPEHYSGATPEEWAAEESAALNDDPGLMLDTVDLSITVSVIPESDGQQGFPDGK